jgi:hypothetical protein
MGANEVLQSPRKRVERCPPKLLVFNILRCCHLCNCTGISGRTNIRTNMPLGYGTFSRRG